MRPIKLTLENLRSYRNRQEISFESLGLFAITGSTGAGKSSLLEGLVYALYGCSTWDKRSVKALISDGPGEPTMTVGLEFEVRGQRWRVDRSCSKSNKSSIHCLRQLDGEGSFDGETEVNKQVKALLGLDVEQFLKTVVLPQGKFQQLLDASPTDRSAVLKSLLGLDELDRLLETVSGRSRQVDEGIKQGQAQRRMLPADPAAAVGSARQALEEARRGEQLSAGQLEGCRAQGAALEQGRAGLAELLSKMERARALEQDLGQQLEQLDQLEQELARQRQQLAEEQQQARQAQQAAEQEQAEREANQTTPKHLTARLQQARLRDELRPLVEKGRLELEAGQAELTTARAELEKLTVELTELAEQRDKLKADGQRARAAQGEARTRSEEATRWLDAWRTLAAQLDKVRQKLAHEQAAFDQESEGLEGFEQIHQRAQAEVAEQKLALQRMEQEQRVAAVAGHCQPEDPCPVCARPLPEGFQPPRGEGLEEAQKALKSAESRQQAAYKSWQAELARSNARSQQLGKLAREEREAVADLAQKTAQGETLLGGALDPQQLDECLLEPVQTRLQQAEQALEKAQESWRACDARYQSCQALQGEKQRTLEAGAARIERSRSELEERSQRLAEAERELAGVELETLQQELEAAEQLEERLKACLGNSHRLTRAENELHLRAQKELDQPRREVEKTLHDRRAQLAALGVEPELPERTGEAARLLEAERLAALERWGREQAEQESSLAVRERELTARLQELGAASLPELEQRVRQVSEGRARAEAALESAEAQQALAVRLDEKLLPAERLKRYLDFIQTTLGNRGRKNSPPFSQWLLELRQQELLRLASVRLLEMTGQQYEFSKSFAIADKHTGQARKPETLSGGETFMASLALALALSELVGRKGGRLEAFFLDEGFGSLSPDCLDRALDALENLAGSGRLIGVISHVGAVAERLERVLRVERTPQGSQVCELSGPALRESAAQELGPAVLSLLSA